MSNLGPGGSLDTDRVARALLQHRNCPDQSTGLSPAQIIFGRVLKDHLPLQPDALRVRRECRLDAERREQALAQRHLLKHEQLQRGTKPLPPLSLGDHVMIQDQAAAKQPGKWTKTGIVVEDQGFDSYLIKVDGSHRVTKRNRRFLRKVIPFIQASDNPPELRNNTTKEIPSSTILPSPTPITLPLSPPSKSPPPTLPSPQQKKRNPPRKEQWIVADKFKQKSDVYSSDDQVDKKVVDVNDDQVPVDVNDDQLPVTTDDDQELFTVNDDHIDAPAPSSSTTPNPSSPPILLPTTTPPVPGSSHDYAAMAQESERLRKQVLHSRRSSR